MARQFQGYARGRGFTSRSPGAGAVSRIQEQGNKTIQGLKEQLQSKRQQDQQYASELNSNFNRSQAIKGEIKSFEDKAFDLKMSNIKQNQEQSLRNIEVEAEKQARVYEQLSKFAPTLGETIVDVKDAFDEANNKAAFANSIFNFDQLSSPPSDLDKAGEEQLFKANATAETSNQKSVKENGLPQSTAQAQNKQSHYRQLKNTDARIAALGRAFRERATFDNHGIGLLHELIEEFGLYGVRQQRFYEVAQDISKIQAGFQAENRRVSAINTSSELVTTSLNQLIDNPTISNARNFYQTLSTSTDDGRSALTRPQVLDKFFKALENTNLTQDHVELIMGMEMIDEYGNGIGETFLQRHGKAGTDGTSRYQTLLNNRAKARIDGVNLRENQLKAEQKQNFLDASESIEQLGEINDPAPYIAELDDVDLSKEQRNLLSEKLTDQSKYGKEQKNVDRMLQYALDNGQPMDQIFMQAKGKTRAKWKSIVAEVNNKMQAANVSDTENRKRLLKQGKLRLNVQSIDKIYDTSLDYATDDRVARVQQRRQELIRIEQKDYATANKQAMAEEIALIKDSDLPEYKPEGATTGDGSTHNYYGYYSPGGGYFTNVVQANKHQALQAVRARPDSIKDVFLAPTSYYAGVYDSIQNNKPIPESSLFNELHKVYPDALQLQLNKYTTEMGLPPVTIPLTQNQYLAANAEDPRLKQFALRMDTIQEERIYPVAADRATQMGLQAMSPGVQAAYQNMAPTAFDTGAVIGGISVDGARRAIFGNESGNNFRAVNPHSGALGIAQVMPANVGPWSQEILGRTVSQQEFLNNPGVQMAIINGKLQKYFQQEAAKGFTGEVLLRRVASIWYSGQADLYDNAPDEYYNGHKYPSIRNYTKDIAKRYRSGQ